MKEIKQLYLLIFLIVFISEDSISQNWGLGITSSFGLSKVTEYAKSTKYDTKFAPSYQLGCSIERSAFENSKFGLGVNWVQIESKAIREDATLFLVVGFSIGDSIGVADITSKLRLGYIGVPLYYKHEIGKFNFLGGIRTMFLIHTSEYAYYDGILRDEAFEEKIEQDHDEFDKLDIGFYTALGYRLSKKFNITMDFYLGANDIQGDRRGKENKIRQFGVGINYTINGE